MQCHIIRITTGTSALILVLSLCFFAGPVRGRPLTAEAADQVDAFMGDWQGMWRQIDEKESPLVAQVIALGSGRCHANLFAEFDKRTEPIAMLEGQLEGTAVNFAGWGDKSSYRGYRGPDWHGVIENGKFTGTVPGRLGGKFRMHKVTRLSPTLGAKPPAGAIVLFDGTSLEQWEHPGGTQGFINLGQILGGENCAAYLRSRIWSPRQQQVFLEPASDDGLKVWLNGRLVLAENVTRTVKRFPAVAPWQNRARMTLKQGWNVLMLKVTNNSGDWATCVRFSAEERAPVPVDIREEDLNAPSGQGTSRYLKSNDNFLTVWQVAGPYRIEGKSGSEIFDAAFPPETGKEVKWRTIERSEIEKKSVQWRLIDDAMEVVPGTGSILSKKKFTDCKLHLEFRTRFIPEAREQARSNSGVFPQGRYEVQVLDTYGLEGRSNECGAIYDVAAPLVNMCAPPMQWQSYDITFYAPRFDNTGRKTKNARMTVIHNGVMIHDNVEVPGPTGAAIDRNITEPGGLYLQEHGEPVQYRNIWVVELPK